MLLKVMSMLSLASRYAVETKLIKINIAKSTIPIIEMNFFNLFSSLKIFYKLYHLI